jgi:hypothetical protein
MHLSAAIHEAAKNNVVFSVVAAREHMDHGPVAERFFLNSISARCAVGIFELEFFYAGVVQGMHSFQFVGVRNALIHELALQRD